MYGMFLAIIVPPATKSRKILEVVFISAVMSVIFFYGQMFDHLSSGFKLIIATLSGAIYGAWRYPLEEDGV